MPLIQIKNIRVEGRGSDRCCSATTKDGRGGQRQGHAVEIRGNGLVEVIDEMGGEEVLLWFCRVDSGRGIAVLADANVAHLVMCLGLGARRGRWNNPRVVVGVGRHRRVRRFVSTIS
jgi:hypothetical protein